MISERDVWASANILLDKYGDAAEIRASQRADELLGRGDVDGYSVWLRIVEAVRQLTETERSKDTRLH